VNTHTHKTPPGINPYLGFDVFSERLPITQWRWQYPSHSLHAARRSTITIVLMFEKFMIGISCVLMKNL